MTNNSPSSKPDGIIPAEIESIEELVSALVDGELPRDEMVDLEEHAVDVDTTIQHLVEPTAETSAQIGSLLEDPAPSQDRTRHIHAALDAMDSPEVLSLAAARADRQSDADRAKLDRSQRLNTRLRQLTSVAAVAVIVGGFGLFVASVSGGGEDDTASAGLESNEDAGASAETMLREAAQASDDSASDDGAMEESLDTDLMDAAPEATTPASSGAFDGDQPPVAIPDDIVLSELTYQSFANEAALAQAQLVETDKTVRSPPACLDAVARAGETVDQIVSSITVVQAGVQYELVVTESQELLVYELPGCDRID